MNCSPWSKHCSKVFRISNLLTFTTTQREAGITGPISKQRLGKLMNATHRKSHAEGCQGWWKLKYSKCRVSGRQSSISSPTSPTQLPGIVYLDSTGISRLSAISIHLCFLCFWDRGRAGGREEARERDISMRQKHQSIALTPSPTTGTKQRHVPWPGIEPATFQFAGRCPTNELHQPRLFFFQMFIHYIFTDFLITYSFFSYCQIQHFKDFLIHFLSLANSLFWAFRLYLNLLKYRNTINS